MHGGVPHKVLPERRRKVASDRLGNTDTPSGSGGRRRSSGFAPQISQREIGSITSRIAPELDAIIASVELENVHMPENTRQYHGGELRLLRAIRYVIVAQILQKIS